MFGKNVTGEAAKNAVTKLLGTNLVISAVSIAAVSLPDLYRALVSKTISWQQFGKNLDRKSTRLNSSHVKISYAVFCLKKKKKKQRTKSTTSISIITAEKII